jgi:hypothetical protein
MIDFQQSFLIILSNAEIFSQVNLNIFMLENIKNRICFFPRTRSTETFTPCLSLLLHRQFGEAETKYCDFQP